MRLIKCDMCGHVATVGNEDFMEVKLQYAQTGYFVGSYDICEECCADLKKILTANTEQNEREEE